jgi:predicted ATP-grasp superfamily ATP-dependent carboligase
VTETDSEGEALPPAGSAGRVVLTHGRSLMALAAARSLGRRGVEVIGCDDSPMMALSFSRYVTKTFLHAPPDDREAYLDSLAEGVRKYAPDDGRPYALMPIHDQTIAIARDRERFAPAVVAAPPIAAIDKVYPKDRLADTARRLGVAMPATAVVRAEAELEDAAAGIGFPMFVKPADATGGRGIAKIKAPEELTPAVRAARASGRGEEVLLQAPAPGEDYCLTALCRDGRIEVAMAYYNLETLGGAGGFGVLRETVEAGPMPEVAQRLLGPLGWHGVVQLDFRWDGDPATTPQLIEVNPRFWGGLFQSVESGVDYPWLLYRLATAGEVPERPQPEIGRRTKVPMLWLMGAVEELAEDAGGFQALSAAWEEAKGSMRRGQWWAGFGRLADGLGQSFTPNLDRAKLEAQWRRAADASPEMFNADDPYAGLGLLYVLGSLIRNGRAPEELRR